MGKAHRVLGVWTLETQKEKLEASDGVCSALPPGVLFRVILHRNRWHLFRWVLFQLPGPSICPKGHL